MHGVIGSEKLRFFSDAKVQAALKRGGFEFSHAEDGIRDYKVTGVQTCALPIYPTRNDLLRDWGGRGGVRHLRRDWRRAVKRRVPPSLGAGTRVAGPRSRQDPVSARRLEGRPGVRLATEHFYQHVLEVRQHRQRPKPWIVLKGRRAEKPLCNDVVYGSQRVRMRSVVGQLTC